MLKDELLDKLELVKPALGVGTLIPIFNYLCFDGDTVFAYNDQIGISTPLQTDFTGAVLGKTMIDLLKASAVKEVSMTADEGNLTIKAGSSRLKLPVISDDFIFKMPKPPKWQAYNKTKLIFRAALDHCMRSIGTNPGDPAEIVGVTVIAAGGQIELFSTDRMRMSYAAFADTDNATTREGRIILSEPFCKAFLKLTTKDDFSLWVNDGHVLVEVPGGMLFGKLLVSGKIDLHSVLNMHTQNIKHMVEMPKRLKYIADRAAVIAGKDAIGTEVIANNGVIEFHTVSKQRGESHDTLEIDGQPDVRICVDAKTVADACEKFDRMIFTSRCLAMGRSDSKRMYLIGTVNK